MQLLEAVTIPVITKTTRRTPVAISKTRSQVGCCILSCLCTGCLDPFMPPRWPVEPPTPKEYIHVQWELKSDLGRLQSVNYIDCGVSAWKRNWYLA